MINLLKTVSENGRWGQAEQDELLHIWRAQNKECGNTIGTITTKRAAAILDIYAHPQDSGRRYLESLQNYYEVFFAEEEKRIGDKLQQATQKTRHQVEGKTPVQVVTELTGSAGKSVCLPQTGPAPALPVPPPSSPRAR